MLFNKALEGKLKNLPGCSNISLKASVRILSTTAADKGQVILVMSVDDPQHKVYKYVIAKDSEITYKPGDWFELSCTDVIDRIVPADGNYKVYVWYTGKGRIFVDDLKLEYMPVGYE